MHESRKLPVQIRRTEEYTRWYNGLRDIHARARIITRLARLEEGNFGDCKHLRAGVFELRINYGPGYRIYFLKEGDSIVLLLAGGVKDSQAKDIEKAVTQAAALRRT